MAKKEKEKAFIVSDESVNSYGFRLKSSGGRFELFKKNPVMLYDHDYNRLPIGTWSGLSVEKNGTITAVPDFDSDDDFALKVQKKVHKDIVKMASVGVIPLKIDSDNFVIEWELLEISVTPIGSNRNAFRLYDKNKNIIELSDKQAVLKLKQELKEIKPMSTFKDSLVIALGLKDDITDKELLRHVVQLQTDKQNLSDKLAKAEGDLNAAKTAKELSEKEALLKLAIDQKKVTEKKKDALLKLSLTDLKDVLDSLPAATNLSRHTQQGGERDVWAERQREIENNQK